MNGVGLVMAHIPTRTREVAKAIKSVMNQTHQVSQMSISRDSNREGSAKTRNRALSSITTKWAAFLDDDDLWLSTHVEVLLETALATNADVVYSGCRVIGPDNQEIPLQEEWGRFGQAFDPDLLREKSYLPVTSLVNTEMAKDVGGFQYTKGSIYDDWGFYLAMLNAGAKFVHVPTITWIWNHHGKNTSGQPDRW